MIRKTQRMSNPLSALDARTPLCFPIEVHRPGASESERSAVPERMKQLITILSFLTLFCSSARADICEAVRYERVERVQAYLAANTNGANFVGEKQCTPLYFAAEHSSSNGIRILEMLLAKGAKVDARNHIHQTPLLWAVIQNNVAGTKVLLAHGAEVNARQDGG